jgi:hypothetical protein
MMGRPPPRARGGRPAPRARGAFDIKHLPAPGARGSKRENVSVCEHREKRWLASAPVLTPHSGRIYNKGSKGHPNEPQANTGADEVTSVSYLPATFTTLFFLAAALLLGLLQ